MALQGYWLHDEPQEDDTFFLHTDVCEYLPKLESRTPLGLHADCWSAVRQARFIRNKVEGCPYCSPACHTTESQPIESTQESDSGG